MWKFYLFNKFETISDSNYLYDWILYQCPTGFRTSAFNLTNGQQCSLDLNNDWVNVLNTLCNKPVLIWAKGNFLVISFLF